jgi:YggT family protein
VIGVLASARTDVAEFLSALLFVYSLLIIIYVLAQLVFSLGARVPYSRWSDAVLGFLRDVCEPYLRPFRRIIPMIGPIDISPIVALIVLRIVGGLIVAAVHG